MLLTKKITTCFDLSSKKYLKSSLKYFQLCQRARVPSLYGMKLLIMSQGIPFSHLLRGTGTKEAFHRRAYHC